ncbi:MAG: hypothetical protein ABIS21_07525 [Acidimicrobiales bacterium]
MVEQFDDGTPVIAWRTIEPARSGDVAARSELVDAGLLFTSP